MKKQYDLSKLTDELSKSVFFQEPEQSAVSQEKHQSTLALKQESTQAPEAQSAKAPNNQPTKDGKQESTQAPSNQNAKAPLQQASKHLKHISSYLTPESWKRIKMLATEREQHDYEILQNAVDLYFTSLDKKEK